MRELTQIISRRFREAVRDAAKREEERSGRTVDENLIADRMAEYMGAEAYSAHASISRILLESDAFNRQRKDLRSKPRRRQKV